MNIIFLSIIFFIAVFLFLSWFAKASSKKIAKSVRNLLIILSLIVAVVLAIGGRILFSLPLFFLALSALKIKGLTALQYLYLYRLIQFLKNSGRFSQGQFNKPQGSSSVSIDEAYKLLGLKKGCSKEEVLKVAKKLQQKIHPDKNTEIRTEELSKLVNQAVDKIIKTDFS